MAVGFAMADDGLYGGSSPEFASDLTMDAALLARFEDPVGVRRIVPAVALVDIGPLDLASGERLGFFDHLLQGVTIPRVKPEGRLQDCRGAPWHGG